ncbi:UNVERIFIED_CONTAM: hypothetical protein K2H54_036058 [Gekko kuhli]
MSNVVEARVLKGEGPAIDYDELYHKLASCNDRGCTPPGFWSLAVTPVRVDALRPVLTAYSLSVAGQYILGGFTKGFPIPIGGPRIATYSNKLRSAREMPKGLGTLNKAMPMGYAVACTAFEMFSIFLEWAGSSGITHYPDDFFFIGPGDDDAYVGALRAIPT